MKLSEAKHYLPLVQAAAEGKTLQVLVSYGVWSTFTPDAATDFSSPPNCYRVKPEPREFWVRLCPNNPDPGSRREVTDDISDRSVCKYGGCELIHVREVIEGEQ